MLLPFTSPEATLAAAGGKGANLARLTRAGFNVPRGFIISTAAYRAFVAENALETVIASALENLSADDPGALETASAKIRGSFSVGVHQATLHLKNGQKIRVDGTRGKVFIL